MTEVKFKAPNLAKILRGVQSELASAGIEIDLVGELCAEGGEEGIGRDAGGRVKVVCVTPDIKASRDEMSGSSRDHVVMVRVDEETRDALDAWVETGAVKSRSEAAALFIREGLKVRRAELEKLREALDGVESARENLRRKAREVFGEGGG